MEPVHLLAFTTACDFVLNHARRLLPEGRLRRECKAGRLVVASRSLDQQRSRGHHQIPAARQRCSTS